MLSSRQLGSNQEVGTPNLEISDFWHHSVHAVFCSDWKNIECQTEDWQFVVDCQTGKIYLNIFNVFYKLSVKTNNFCYNSILTMNDEGHHVSLLSIHFLRLRAWFFWFPNCLEGSSSHLRNINDVLDFQRRIHTLCLLIFFIVHDINWANALLITRYKDTCINTR